MADSALGGAVHEALWQFGLPADAVDQLSESFNTLFTVVADRHRYVLRLGPALYIHEHDAAQAEAAWTDQLAGRGLTVPRPVRTPDGRAAVTVTYAGQIRQCTLYTWVEGVTLTRPMSATDAARLGELSARLHAASPPVPERPRGALDGRHALLFRLPNLLSDAAEAGIFAAALTRAQSAVDRLWARADAPRLVHGDLTANNVVRTADGLVPIDFQDMFWGHVEQDVAHTLFSFLRQDYRTLADAFRRGYEKHRPLPQFAGADLEDLFAARRVSMANLAIALARPDVGDYLAHHAAALRTYLAAG